MNKPLTFLLPLALLAVNIQLLHAQDIGSDFREEFTNHFNYSSNKVLSLAEEMPESNYTWSPGEGVMSVARVYMHIARYNYYYLESSLDIPAPDDVDLDNMEEITDKTVVMDQLQRSVDHVKKVVAQMPDSRLEELAELYGRTVDGWAVLFQLISHMNEHVGQSIAYARMNDVVPPWSN